MELVDTHQHLWDPGRFPYSWSLGIPSLNRSFDFSEYLSAAAGLSIAKSVFVECDVDEPHMLEEARMVQALSGEHPSIAGIVAGCRPERIGFEASLEKLAALSRVRGVRRVLHNQPDGLSGDALFAQSLRLLPKFGFSFDLCVLARQLPQAVSLVSRCPDVSFVLDHCGVPDVRAGALEPWKSNITELAAFPNVACKISGLVAYADPATWSAEVLRPWVEHILEEFGWDRVVWGSDWPVCTLSATLAQWASAIRGLMANSSDLEQSKLFSRNAERIYRI
jgi:predicted TIM-barrel fold metal-dependent hydrolase